MNTKLERFQYSIKKKIIFWGIIYGTLAIIFYVTYSVYRTVPLYTYVMSHQRGWSGQVHAFDAELGYAPIPNSQGAHTFPVGPDIPMQYDKYGFRVPVGSINAWPKPHPLLLTLGCSFSYGDACYAEDTYPYLVGRYLQGYTMNAGVCGYGLSQMFLLAQKLIPTHTPDYVIVQYSAWLVERAQNPFAPTYAGKLSVPYFFENNGEFVLHAPVFDEYLDRLPLVERYTQAQKTILNFFSFFMACGAPLLFHDDVNMTLYHVRKSLRLIPPPSRKRELIETYVYHEIAKIAHTYDSQMIIVVLGENHEPVIVPKHIVSENTIVVNAHSTLLQRLPRKTAGDYYKLYAHWRGLPPQLVDKHPNPYAHKIIAKEIVKSIKHNIQTRP